MDHSTEAHRPSLASVVTKAMESAGVTLRGTAEGTGIPYVTLRRHLTTGDGGQLKAADLYRIAEHLGITASSLMDASALVEDAV